jgi:NAD(P)H dehydrogenase (quinone)
MAIAVTGASGPFGRTSLEGLLDRGVPAEDLIAITRSPERLKDLAARGVSVRYGDYDQPESMLHAASGAETLLLISATLVGHRVPQHKAAIESARTAGVQHIIYTSYTGKDPLSGTNPSLAVRDHRATEDILLRSGLEWTVLRNSQYSEAVVEAMAPSIIIPGRWVTSTGQGRIAQVTRNDCVRAAVAATAGAGERNRIYEITGSELLTFREIAGIFTDITGREIEFVDTDDNGMYAHFDALGIPRTAHEPSAVKNIPWCSDDMVSVEQSIRLGCMAVCTTDVEQLTGRPAMSLREYLWENAYALRALVERPEASLL